MAFTREIPKPLDLSHHYSRVTKNRGSSAVKDFYKYFGIPNIGNLAGGPLFCPPCLLPADIPLQVCPATITSLSIPSKAPLPSLTASSRPRTSPLTLHPKVVRVLLQGAPMTSQHPRSLFPRHRQVPTCFGRSISSRPYNMAPPKDTRHCTRICGSSQERICIPTCRMPTGRRLF